MEVEVAIQDLFAESVSENGAESAEQTRSQPIDPNTWEQWFQQWLEVLQPDLGTQAYELSLRLTDDADIQHLNSQYRHLDKPTDVLAFAALESDYPQVPELLAEMPLYLGDIVISVETAQRQAPEHDHSLEQELAWLAAHGLLHLLGWDHPDDARLMEMLNQQQVLLKSVGLITSEVE